MEIAEAKRQLTEHFVQMVRVSQCVIVQAHVQRHQQNLERLTSSPQWMQFIQAVDQAREFLTRCAPDACPEISAEAYDVLAPSMRAAQLFPSPTAEDRP